MSDAQTFTSRALGNVSLSILMAGVFIALAIAYYAEGQRYELANSQGGLILRLDKRTGDVVTCFPRNVRDSADVRTISISCTGRVRE